jgi:heme/copper-type cytochrome/quinol oxidase subunit 4
MEMKNITREKISNVVLIFLAFVVFLFFVGGTWLCRIYALGIGISTTWLGIASFFSGQIPLISTGASNPLPLFQFNPGLGSFCLGWGILRSVMLSRKKELPDKMLLIFAAILGIVNIVVGLINFLGMPSVLLIFMPGLWGSFLSIFIGYPIVYAVASSWEAAK